MSPVAFVREPRQRRIGYAVLALVLALLCFFPQPYVARAKLVPQDNNSIGLGSMMNALGGQLQGFAALFGGAKQPIDMYLAISRGTEVTDAVISELKLVGPNGYASQDRARVALAKKVDIHSLTGGIVEVEARTHDARQAEAMTRAYVQAISDRIIALGRDRVRRKRDVVLQRFKEAAGRVVKSETALNAFRRRNRLAEPEAQLGSALSLRAGLEAQLQAKLVELQTLQRFQGEENPQLQAVQSEVASLREQIARTASPSAGVAGPNVAGLSEVSGEYLNLYRDYRFAQALYEVYARSSEEVAVETLAAETASDVQLIEAPRLDPDRKYNIPAVALLALLIALALFTEIYAPATGIDLRFGRKDPGQ
ncbi:capsule biosynthesis protein [Sphingomonas psychrotolerans]|uniref:Capsule biosynthesis protein n=1 Tax=Sphingomonas psychrotolerans TaxID=1327635 RepID=A0A2K8MGK7_9SPHN|nr:capsule biosynthesis protein [Sphingomonas psychrotolerans]ATY30879.1 capsule biosynthesis protein [Sphingomonas psychrotolerans]